MSTSPISLHRLKNLKESVVHGACTAPMQKVSVTDRRGHEIRKKADFLCRNWPSRRFHLACARNANRMRLPLTSQSQHRSARARLRLQCCQCCLWKSKFAGSSAGISRHLQPGKLPRRQRKRTATNSIEISRITVVEGSGTSVDTPPTADLPMLVFQMW